jgi:hypothetical protein
MPNQLTLPMPDLPENEPKARKRTPEQAWLAWAASEWTRFQGAPMTVRWARDLTLVRPLLRLHGEQELKLRWNGYLATMDEYFARRGWDVPSFSAAIDRYRGSTDLVPIVRRRQLLEADANDRDPLTGVSLRYRGR